MSVSTELTRITTDRNTIRTKLVNLGLATSTDNLDTLATAINGIVNRGAPTPSVKEGESYTIQAGYYTGGKVSGVSGGGNYTLQAKTATPTKQQQVIANDDGYYGLSQVTVDAIPDNYQDVSSVTATAGDVLTTKTIVTSTGAVVAGTMANNGTVSKSLDTTTTSYTIPAGYHSGSGKVSITTETKTATPSESTQNITPTSGKVLSKVTVNAIPAKYGDATGKTVTSSKLLAGETAIGISNGSATSIVGTMPNRGAASGTITGLGAVAGDTSYTLSAGYYSGGTISLTSDIEDQLAAI